MFPVRPLARRDSWNIHNMQCPDDTLHSSLGFNERTNSLWLPPREYFLALTLSVNCTSKYLIFWCTFITFVNIVFYGVSYVVFVHSMKVYRGSRVISALDCSRWSNSCPAPAVLAPGKIPGTHSIGGRLGEPQKWSGRFWRRGRLSSLPGSQPVAIHYNNYVFPEEIVLKLAGYSNDRAIHRFIKLKWN